MSSVERGRAAYRRRRLRSDRGRDEGCPDNAQVLTIAGWIVSECVEEVSLDLEIFVLSWSRIVLSSPLAPAQRLTERCRWRPSRPHSDLVFGQRGRFATIE